MGTHQFACRNILVDVRLLCLRSRVIGSLGLSDSNRLCLYDDLRLLDSILSHLVGRSATASLGVQGIVLRMLHTFVINRYEVGEQELSTLLAIALQPLLLTCSVLRHSNAVSVESSNMVHGIRKSALSRLAIHFEGIGIALLGPDTILIADSQIKLGGQIIGGG